MALSSLDLSFLNKPQIRRVSSIEDDKIPILVKQVRLEWDRLVFNSSDYGTFSVGVSALAPERYQSKRKLMRFLNRSKNKTDNQWVPLKISPRIPLETFNTELHTQFMWRMPYIVLEDWTRYEITLDSPVLTDSEAWGEFEEEVNNPNDFINITKIIWKRKKAITAVVRVDWKPLLTQEYWKFLKYEIEQLFWWRWSIRNKVQLKSAEIGWALWDEQNLNSIQQSLLFKTANDVGVWNVDDKQWLIEVVFYETTIMEISETVKTPKFSTSALTNFWWSLDFWWSMYWWMQMKWWWGWLIKWWFSGGGTSFWQEKREKVKVTQARVEKPIAAFEFTLVAEMIDQQMEASTAITE